MITRLSAADIFKIYCNSGELEDLDVVKNKKLHINVCFGDFICALNHSPVIYSARNLINHNFA